MSNVTVRELAEALEPTDQSNDLFLSENSYLKLTEEDRKVLKAWLPTCKSFEMRGGSAVQNRDTLLKLLENYNAPEQAINAFERSLFDGLYVTYEFRTPTRTDFIDPALVGVTARGDRHLLFLWGSDYSFDGIRQLVCEANIIRRRWRNIYTLGLLVFMFLFVSTTGGYVYGEQTLVPSFSGSFYEAITIVFACLFWGIIASDHRPENKRQNYLDTFRQ